MPSHLLQKPLNEAQTDLHKKVYRATLGKERLLQFVEEIKKDQRCKNRQKRFSEEQLCESSSWLGRKIRKDFVVLFCILSYLLQLLLQKKILHAHI